MDQSKENAILKAAIHEFAAKGFDQASTNQMAKSAGVSKGLVFHYYDSKEKLFEASVRYALDFSMKELDVENWTLTSHVIRDIKNICEMEIRFYKKYPDIYQFILSAFIRPPRQLSKKMTGLYKKLESMAPQFFGEIIEKLDLKDDVDKDLLKAVFQSHYHFYSSQTMGYLKAHPDATFEEVMPYVHQLLGMLKMSLRGLLHNEEDVLQ